MPNFHYSNQTLGYFLSIAAAVGFSAKTILAKLAYAHGVDALTLLTMRMGMAGLVFFTILFYEVFKGNWSLKLSISNWIMIALLAILGYYLSSYLDFCGLQYIDASLGRMILFLYPTMVVIISSVINKKIILKSTWIILLICYLGIILMMAPNFGKSQNNFWLGSGLVFSSALTYSIYLVCVDRFFKPQTLVRFISLILCLSCLTVFFHFTLARDIHNLVLPFKVYLYALIMAIFSTVIPIYAISYSISLIGASKAAMIGMIGPVITLVMGILILGETITPIQLLGTTLIIGGIVRMKFDK